MLIHDDLDDINDVSPKPQEIKKRRGLNRVAYYQLLTMKRKTTILLLVSH